MEVVGGPGVVVVVDDGGEQQGEDLEVGHPVLQPGLGDDPVRGLQHVAGVQVVVVRVAVPRNMTTYINDLQLVPQKVASELHPKVRNHGEGYYRFHI